MNIPVTYCQFKLKEPSSGSTHHQHVTSPKETKGTWTMHFHQSSDFWQVHRSTNLTKPRVLIFHTEKTSSCNFSRFPSVSHSSPVAQLPDPKTQAVTTKNIVIASYNSLASLIAVIAAFPLTKLYIRFHFPIIIQYAHEDPFPPPATLRIRMNIQTPGNISPNNFPTKPILHRPYYITVYNTSTESPDFPLSLPTPAQIPELSDKVGEKGRQNQQL